MDGKEESAVRLLLLLWLTTALFLVGVALVAAMVLETVTIPAYSDAFYARLCLLKEAFYSAQPAKNDAYLTSCLAAPFLLGGSIFLARSILKKLPQSRLMFFFRCAIIANGLFMVGCLFPLAYCSLPAMYAEFPDWLTYKWFFAGEPFFTFSRFVFLAGAMGLCRFFYALPSSHKNRNLAFAVVIGTWLLVVLSRFYVPVEIDDEWRFGHHFNPLVYGLSQAMNGRHYLIQFPHRYGGYIEFLAPLLAWFPRRIQTILTLFGVLNLVTMGCLLMLLRRLIRAPLQLLLAGWSLLGVLAINGGDNYYQNAVVRDIFPALGLLLATGYLRRPGLLLYAIVSCLAALAPLWNQDTGLVLWCSWTATLIARELSGRSFRNVGWHLAVQVVLLLGAVAAFLIYLRIVGGYWPDRALLFVYQTVFIRWGYLCLPMLVPDAWMLVVAIYAAGLAAAVIFYLRKTFSWRAHAVLMLSLAGLGFFSYFMGRSAESNLVYAGFLVPVLLGLFLSETRGLIALRQLPRLSWFLFCPMILIQVWWALLFVLALPNIMEQSAKKLASSGLDLATTPFGENVAFMQSQTTSKNNLYILSDQSGFYYYLTDTASDLDLASTDEFIWTKDIDRLVSAIDLRQIPKLFVDRNFFETRIYKNEVYDRIAPAIAQYYRPKAISPDARVTLYVPR